MLHELHPPVFKVKMKLEAQMCVFYVLEYLLRQGVCADCQGQQQGCNIASEPLSIRHKQTLQQRWNITLSTNTLYRRQKSTENAGLSSIITNDLNIWTWLKCVVCIIASCDVKPERTLEKCKGVSTFSICHLVPTHNLINKYWFLCSQTSNSGKCFYAFNQNIIFDQISCRILWAVAPIM